MNKKILKSMNVLYVEDEDDVREFTSKTINSIVNKVIPARNGIEALEKFQEIPEINLILTDINMPKMDGLEMCSEIRKIDGDIPIIITSAHSDPNFLKKAIDVKVSAYAMKPIDLYNLIENMVKAAEPIFLRKELEEINTHLENKVEEESKKRKSILDAQDNMVILTNHNYILEGNKNFLEFFNVDSIEQFNSNKSLVKYFKNEESLFSEKNIPLNSSWIDYLSTLNDVDRIVKITNNKGEDKIFNINIDHYEREEEYFIISFIDITQLKEKSNLLEYQANYDQLTGLFNKQKFNEIFKKEFKREKRYKNSLSIILFDIDNYSILKDKFEEKVSEDILKVISSILVENIREQDTVVKWSTSQFLILLPQTNIEGAKKVAEKIRLEIESCKNTKLPSPITGSFGVSALDIEKDDEESFIKKANDALITANSLGQNKVITKS